MNTFSIITFVRDLVTSIQPSTAVTDILDLGANKYAFVCTDVTEFSSRDNIAVWGLGSFDSTSIEAVTVAPAADEIIVKYTSTYTIPELIDGVITKNTPRFVHFESWEVDKTLQELSTQLKGFPVIGLVEPITWTDEIKENAQVDSVYNIQVLFADRAQFHNISNENDEYWTSYINAMTTLAYEFLKALRAVDMVENASIRDSFESLKNYNTASNKVAGVMLRVSFKYQNCRRLC